MAVRALVAAGAALAAVLALWFGSEAPAREARAAGSHLLFLPLIAGEPPNPAFLQRLNLYRALGGLPPVQEDLALSRGAANHARYMVENNAFTHFEVPTLPFFTTDGKAAAQGHLYQSSGPFSSTEPIDGWIAGPLHGTGLLNPLLTSVVFGLYSGMTGTGAVINHFQGIVSAVPKGFAFPFVFPKAGSKMPIDRYPGGETPDPLTACPNFVAPSGPPIYFQFDSPPNAYTYTASSQLSAGGSVSPLESCAFSGQDYVNPNPADQSIGRSVLSKQNAVIVLPKSPLAPGRRYMVSVGSGNRVASTAFDYP